MSYIVIEGGIYEKSVEKVGTFLHANTFRCHIEYQERF